MATHPRRDGVPVKPVYDMPTPNAGLPLRGRLPELCEPGAANRNHPRNHNGVPPWSFVRDGGALHTFLDPDLVERFFDTDYRLRGAAASLADRLEAAPRRADVTDSDLRTVFTHLDRVFEDVVVMDLMERWETLKPLLARYVLAKEASRRIHPDRFPEPED